MIIYEISAAGHEITPGINDLIAHTLVWVTLALLALAISIITDGVSSIWGFLVLALLAMIIVIPIQQSFPKKHAILYYGPFALIAIIVLILGALNAGLSC